MSSCGHIALWLVRSQDILLESEMSRLMVNFFLPNVTGVPEAYRQKATTMNLLSTIEKASEISDVSTRNMVTPRNFNSMNLFPQQAGLGSSIPKEVVLKKTDSRCIMIVIGVQDILTSYYLIYYVYL